MATLPPYTEPGVTVEQDFTQQATTLALFNLPNVIVGPVFNIVFDDDVGPYTGSAAAYAYEHQPAGTTVDTRAPTGDLVDYPVTVTLEETVVQLQQAVTGVIAGSNLNQVTDATVGIFANVQAGDIFIVTDSTDGNEGQYTVRQVVDANTLNINETFEAAETGLNYTLLRNVGTVAMPAGTPGLSYDFTEVLLPAGFGVAVSPYVGSLPVTSAEVHLAYRALRTDYSGDVKEFDNPAGGGNGVADLQAAFGLDQVVPQNPAVFGAFLALSQVTPSVNLLGLPVDFLDTGSGSGDELLAYELAFDVVAMTDMYAVSVLTQNPAVASALSSFVTLYAQPENRHEMVGIVNVKLITTQIVVESETTEGGDGLTTAYPSGTIIFTDANATFITDNVVPGMFLNITAPSGAAGRWKISAVTSQTSMQVAYTGTLTPPVTPVTYFIDENLTLDQQADTLAAYAASIGNRRMVMTWPDQVAIPSGNVIKPYPGYFLNVAVGALITGLPTQQGFTNTTVAIYAGVIHSTKYFTDPQLNRLAAGGVMIFVQDVLNVTQPKIRHQLTTDRSTILFQELSITKNVDFVAQFLRVNHNPFIGKYNIVDQTLDDLKTFAARNILYLKEQTIQPRIGGIINNGTLSSISQDPVNIDHVLEDFQMDFPIPLNGITIRIFAS